MASRARGHFHVAPRYTPGSPAMVNEHTAQEVAKDELDAFRATGTGVYGQEKLAQAVQLGLEGIAERRVEIKGGWQVEDLITGRTFVRPFPNTPTKRRAGKPTRRTR